MVAPPQKPLELIHVQAVKEREALEIRFPRVLGYRTELPDARIEASFTPDSTFDLTPEQVGACITRVEGIVGEGINLTVEHLAATRPSTILFTLTSRLMTTTWREAGKEFDSNLFFPLKRVTKQWLDHHLVCSGGTYLPGADSVPEPVGPCLRAHHGGHHGADLGHGPD